MLFLALRHLLSRKRQSLLTLVGILLGTAAYIAISGMMLGFQTFIVDQLINNDAHIRISAREDVITEHSLDADFLDKMRWSIGSRLRQAGATMHTYFTRVLGQIAWNPRLKYLHTQSK